MLEYALNEVTTGSWPLDRDVDCCIRHGIPAISVREDKLEAYGVERGIALLGQSGLIVASLVNTGRFTLDDRSCWPAELEETRRMLRLSARMKARQLQLVSGGLGQLSYEDAEARFSEILGALLPDAEAAGVVMCLEHNSQWLQRLGFIQRLHDALDLADAIDSPWFTICMEIQNAWRERGLYDNLARRSGRIGLVQVSDRNVDDPASERLPVGDGQIPIGRIVKTLVDAGYRGAFDLEVVGPCRDALGPEETVRRCVDGMNRLGL